MKKIKKTSTITKKDENGNMLLEYIEDIDDKLFKEYSNSKNFNSFLNEFDCATNKEDKENVVKKLKDKNSFVDHYIFKMTEDSEYSSKLLILLMLLIIFWINTLKNERVILIGGNSQM